MKTGFGFVTAWILLCFFSHDSMAATLEGEVLIRGSRDTLEGVNVFVLPSKVKTVTDRNGRFKFENLEQGKVKLVINHPGFIRQEDELDLTHDLSKIIYLERENTLLYETTIESKDTRDLVKRTLNQKKAAAQPGAGSDPVRAIQNLPGVNRSQGFSSQVIIQGSAPQDTRYTIDGHEIPLIFHFGGLSSVFNPDLTESFDFLSAGYQSNYGRAMGGILNLNSRNLDNRRFKASGFVDTFNSGLLVETPVGEKGQLAVGGRISYIGQVLKAVLGGSDNFSLTVAPSYGDVGLLYQRPLSDRLKFKFTVIGSQDALNFIASAPLGGDPSLRGTFSNQIGFFRLIPQFEWTHSARSKTVFSTAMGRDFINTDIGSNYFNLRTIAATIRAENRLQVSDTFLLNTGMDHRLSWADVGFKLPRVFNEGGLPNPLSTGETRIAELKNVASNLFGFYVNPVWKPAVDSRWTLHPGFRLDYFAPINEWRPAPRVSGSYQLDPTLSLIAAGGLYAQSPLEQQYSPGFGNPAIRSSSSWHLRLGAEKDFSASLTRGSEAYTGVFARWFDRLVIPDTSTIFSNFGKGQAIGWETSVTYNLDPWNFFGAYTLSRSTRSDPSRSSYLYQFDQTHFLTLIAGVNLKRNWRISSRFRYVTGPLDTIPTSAVGDLDNDVFIPIRGALFSSRLDAFMMFDLRIDKRWVYDTWTLSLYLDIQNVTNRQNTEGLQFAYDYRTFDKVNGIPILPTFGLKGEF
jgi:hypothetical protein